MKVLLTGASGCLGTYLLRCAPADYTVVAAEFKRSVHHTHTIGVDLRDTLSVSEAFEIVKPDLVVHAAYDPADLQGGIVDATRFLVDESVKTGAQFIYISSDLVLDGNEAPYDETASPAPIIPYGVAKAEAEVYVMERIPGASVIRTSLIVGLDPLNPSSQWILDSLADGQNLSLFVDELRCPILAEDLADMIWEIAALETSERKGVWNCVGPEVLSRFAIGLILAKRFGRNLELILPAMSSDNDTPRPKDLRMSSARVEHSLKTRARPISTIVVAP